MKTIFFTLLCILYSVFITGCFHEEEDKGGFTCPTIGDDVTWSSYGSYQFNKSGNDSTARNIISKCGWHVHNNHNGGYGDTLQVASPNGEVILVWAYNSFYAYKLSSGWSGKTERNIKIGDHITTLYGQYPTFTTTNGTDHQLEIGNNINVKATSDDSGFVSTFTVGQYYRN